MATSQLNAVRMQILLSKKISIMITIVSRIFQNNALKLASSNLGRCVIHWLCIGRKVPSTLSQVILFTPSKDSGPLAQALPVSGNVLSSLSLCSLFVGPASVWGASQLHSQHFWCSRQVYLLSDKSMTVGDVADD
jgi:hypothetical protein